MGKIIIIPLGIAAALFAAGGITVSVLGRERTIDRIKELDLNKLKSDVKSRIPNISDLKNDIKTALKKGE